MDKLAKESKEERAAIFTEVAAKMGISPVIIEKDFWVCWMLQKIFSNLDNNYPMIFKGGTSLSKVYNAIKRFSEDIDLAFNWKSFGFDDAEFSKIGSNEKKRRIAALEKNCIEYIANEFKPKLEKNCSKFLESGDWSIEIDSADPQTLLFNYPTSFPTGEYSSLDYIRPSVKLELGAKSDHEPRKNADVSPYIASHFPDLFDNPNAPVVALDGSRTFWEKLTILHAEYHRPSARGKPERLSRHYYDAVMLYRHNIGKSAIHDLALLQSVVQHKNAFFRSGWANYGLAKPGTIKLVPHDDLAKWLRKDYQDMQEMIFEDAPTLEEIAQKLTMMERVINSK